MKIKFISILTIFIMLLSLIYFPKNTIQAVEMPLITYTVSSDNIRIGDYFTITVNANNLADFYGASLDFKYDITFFEITSVEQGSIFTGSGKTVINPVNNILNKDGNLSYALLFQGNTGGVNIDTNGGSLFIIHIKALKKGSINLNTISDNSDLTADGNNIRLQLSDSNGNSISYSAIPESLSINFVEIDEIENFITRFYECCLNRIPDTDGFNFWVNGLINRTFTGAEVAYNFIFSQEFINLKVDDYQFINIMYKTFFDRDPESSGELYWLDRLANGNSRLFVLASFINSQEFKTICNNYGINRGIITLTKPADLHPVITEFVYRLYVICLERKPDDDGFNYYVNQIATGKMSGSQAVYNFIFSPEFNSKNLSNTEFVTIMYRALFNREPDSEGLTYYINKLNSGTSRMDEINVFVNSAEFAGVCNNYGIIVN